MSVIQRNPKVRKWTVGTVLVFFILTQVLGGVFFYARPAEAQLVVSDPVTGVQTTIKNIKDFLKVLVVNAGTMALINAASRFMQKISYDLAVSLASGGGGQMPLFSTKGWGDYLGDAALDAAGEFIGSFGDMVGVNFCAPPNPRLGLSLQLQLSQTYAEGLPPPTCEWSSIRSNWDSFIAEVQTEDFLREAASQFQIGYGAGTDLDLAVSTYVGAFNAERSASESAALTREEGQGFLPSSDFISGNVKTPAEVIRQTSQIQTEGPVNAEQLKWSLSGQALSAGAQGILTMVASTFVSTLLSKTMERIFSKGMYSLADLFPEGEDATSKEGTAWGGRRAAELAFADLLVPQIKEGGAYDILSDFIVCPEKFKGVNNCVMDGKFEAAVRQAQTGDPFTVTAAIDQGYLDGNWPLIPSSDLAKNQDPYCYTYGFCYSNLVKLRKARIIPIGWEIAAQSNTSTNYVKLKEVVDRFRDCNAADEADTEHPYCHLIDPNWILKAPAEQCRARVYGPLLQTAENSFRQEVCVDSPTCIAEDDKGNCEGGWGYCTREKNILRLDGDKCDAQYDTCKLLRRSDGQNVAYVTNTVDYGPPCTAEDIGCRWYSDRQSKVGDEWVWQDTLTGSGAAARRNDRIFFNKNITQCDEPGCNEFLRTTPDTRLNLIANSSFENFTGTIDDGAEDTFASWTKNYTPSVPPQAVSGTYLGNSALRLQGVMSQAVPLERERGGRTFTLSLFAKGCGNNSRFGFDVSDRIRDNPSASETSWQRYSTTITFPDTDASKTISVTLYNVDMNASSPCLTDAVQLEEGAFASQYHEGWGRTGEALYLKTAPDYYSCYDYTTTGALNKTNDAEQCKNYATACEEKDVGCEEYRPTNGDPSVPGVANYPDDYCPAECVGYQTFKQVETDFEQEKFPVYFIPTTGRTCSAADVGCDQFTSLENEAVANFTYVRRCEKPGVTSASFYTWEGSDTTGYQLKTWSLKRSNVLSAPISDSDPSGGVPPCTALASDGLTCDGLSSIGLCTKTDTLINPDCREFYDAAGLKHYRLYSKTIVATDDCHPYRKTVSSAADCGTSGGKWDTVKSECAYQIYLPESRSCSNDAVGCRAYRGNAGANTALLFSDNFDNGTPGGTSSDWSAGTISSESLVVGGKSLSLPAGAVTTKDVSTLVRKGGIYTLSFWAKGNGRLDIKFGSADSGQEFSSDTLNPTNLSFDWRYFSLGPIYLNWDPAAAETLEITTVLGTSPAYLDNITLREIQSYIYVVKNSWATPTSCDRSFSIDTSVGDATTCASRGGSWSADRNECVLSAILPQAQLGCASYYDRANGLHYLKSFSRLCSPDVAGCEKLIKTGNNSSATLETFNTENDSDPSLSDEERLSDNVTIPADSFAYIVVNDANKCAAQNVGCAEFGSPTLDQTGNVKVGEDGKALYDTVNLLANPSLYNSTTGRILCQVGFQGCEEYATTEGGKLYFKNPEPRLCEWKDNVSISGQNVSGWFKKGVEPLEACDPANFNGGYYNIWKNGDANCILPYVCQTAAGCSCTVGTAGATGKTGTTCTVSYNKRSCPYSGWIGECVPQADQCTKFVDPTDTTNDPLGAAYYYLKNDKLSSGNCNGMVSQRDGCVLFNDTSNPQLNKNADVTYRASEDLTGDPGGLVAPLDCQTSDSCKRCFRPSPGGAPPFRLGDYCQQSTDCPSGYTCTVMNDIYSFLLSRGVAERTDIVIDELMPGKVFKLNNANTLYQVRRDRICGEWLTCSGTNHTFDPQTGREKVLCEQIDVCNQYAKVGQATAQCTNLITPTDVETNRKLLSKDLYISRDVTFKGMDYSGDSIYNQYQAQDLRSVNVGTIESPVPALAFVDNRCFDAAGLTTACVTRPDGFCASDVNDSPCGGNGKCFNHICVTNFRGDPFVPGTVKAFDVTNRENVSCRAYPEQSSPFPNSVVKNWTPLSKKPGFSGANICENGEDCDCSYKKASYGSGAVIKYFDKDNNPLPSVCVGGKEAGKTCSDDAECTGGGTCNSAEREDVVLGWNGYCLERDTGTSINGNSDQFACLTWYPMDQIPGMPDLFNNYPEAGFETTGFNYYCLQPELYKNLKAKDSYDCYDASEPGECDPEDRDYCKQVHCPEGFVTIIGACEEWGGACVGDVWDDCPYKCVPINSHHTTSRTTGEIQWAEGEKCFPDVSTTSFPALPSGDRPQLTAWRDTDGLTGLAGGGNYRDSNDKRYDDCQWNGAPYSHVNATTVDSEYFVGCKEAAQIHDPRDEFTNKAWTDRMWLKSSSPPRFYTLSVPTSGRTADQIAKLRYSYQTGLLPFGKINFNNSTIDISDPGVFFPSRIKVCRAGASGSDVWRWSLTSTDPDLSCPAPSEVVPTSQDNEGRPFTLIETTPSVHGASCTENIGCNSSGNICLDNFKCFQSCNSAADCASGDCISAPRDSDTNKKYCVDVELGGRSERACATGGGVWVGECRGAPYDGEKCRVHESCWANLCDTEAGGYCYSRDGARPGINSSLSPHTEDLSLGIDAFKQLFAKIYQIWEWNTALNRYEAKSTPPTDEDITDKAGTAPGPEGAQWPAPPQVWPITKCTGDKCAPLKAVRTTPVNGVTVGGISGFGFTGTGSTEPINVVGYGGQYVSVMQFFGTADPNAGPIRDVQVDWNDGSELGGTKNARYKNHLGIKDDGSLQCDNTDFSRSAGACTEDYFYFTHTYKCPENGAGVDACTSDTDTNCYAQNSCPEDVNGAVAGNGSCCVFKPRVQFVSGQDPWTYFAGKVIVVPK
ncbi:hypothetical protein HZB93_02140 [Candidatus Falkowbacteria bacterium]|nr:hypothetical protein [Candidatus Falkowbacteria bacterium]